MDRLAAMQVFVCVVQTGSFSAAARRLRVGQPAVSKTVAQLEKRLGVHLLLRSTRGLTPTQAGNSFYELVKCGIDVALHMGTLPDSALTARKIGQSPRQVIGTPAYFRKHREPKLPAE